MIADENITAVVFFIDPLDVRPHEVDVNMLLRICNVYNIPLATNYATATCLIKNCR
jgi:methylglyoxal synthase